jgi:hypothetical protein
MSEERNSQHEGSERDAANYLHDAETSVYESGMEPGAKCSRVAAGARLEKWGLRMSSYRAPSLQISAYFIIRLKRESQNKNYNEAIG